MIRRAALGFLVAAVIAAGTSITPRATALPGDAPVTALLVRRAFPMTLLPDGRVAPPFEPATILIRDGKIAAIGNRAEVAIPEGAQIEDWSHVDAFPGFFDSGTGIGIQEIGAVPATVDVEEGSSPVIPEVRTEDSFNPQSELIAVARLGGITTVLVEPGDGGVFTGQSAAMDLTGLQTVAESVRASRVAIHMNLGSGVTVRWSDRNAMPSTRMGLAALARDTWTKAREYAASQDRYAKKKAEWEKKVAAGPAADAGDAPEPPKTDLRQEALVRALRREVPVIARANRADDILTAIRIADEFNLRLILSEACAAWRIAPILAEKQIPVLYGPVTMQPDSMDRLDARYDAPALLAAAGVRFAIRSGEQYNVRNLRFEAGIAAANGLDPLLALRAVTAAPAEILGIPNVGTLVVGAAANLVLANGDPLQAVTPVDGKRAPTLVQVVVRGVWMPMESRQTRLAAQFRDRRAP